MMTFLEIARLIATTDGLRDEAVPLILRRIRIFDSKGLIPVTREDSGRREGRLDLSGACRARIASELIDFGLDADTLRGLRKSLDHLDVENQRSEFDSAIELIKKGSSIALLVSMKKDDAGKWHSFRLEGLPEAEGASRAKRAQSMVRQPITRAVLRMDLGDLLGDFIAAFEAAS